MKGQLKVSTPAQYIAKLKEPRKSEVAALDQLIRECAPRLDPYIQVGILAYGHCRFKYANGSEKDWLRIGVASNANYISLYVSGADQRDNIAARYKKALPKAKIGNCCVRFKRLSDLDQTVLRKMISESANVESM
jgi:hypothetical protein